MKIAAQNSPPTAPFAGPNAAARKLMELANAVEPVQDGRIHIEKINWPFLSELKGAAAVRLARSWPGCCRPEGVMETSRLAACNCRARRHRILRSHNPPGAAACAGPCGKWRRTLKSGGLRLVGAKRAVCSTGTT
jgi:hypothetical protein